MNMCDEILALNESFKLSNIPIVPLYLSSLKKMVIDYHLNCAHLWKAIVRILTYILENTCN